MVGAHSLSKVMAPSLYADESSCIFWMHDTFVGICPVDLATSPVLADHQLILTEYSLLPPEPTAWAQR